MVIGTADLDVETLSQSVEIKSVQTSLKNNVWPVSCSRCKDEESVNTSSYRIDYNEMYPEFVNLTGGVRTLHFQHDNTCNLMCVYCGPNFSSQWQSKNKTFNIKKSVIKINDDTIKNLRMVTFAGGEPSLIKSYIELVDRITLLNPSCEIVVNTNLTHFHDSKFFRLLETHKNTKIIVSYETTEKKFEYIRHYANWKIFENNFKQAVDRFEIVQSSMILFPLSIVGIKDAIDFAKVRTSEDSIFINDYHGNQFKWSDIGSVSLDKTKENLLNYADSLTERLSNEIKNRIKSVVSKKEKTEIVFLDNFDKQQNVNHKIVFPELYE